MMEKQRKELLKNLLRKYRYHVLNFEYLTRHEKVDAIKVLNETNSLIINLLQESANSS